MISNITTNYKSLCKLFGFTKETKEFLEWEDFVKEVRSSGITKFSEYRLNKKQNWPAQPSTHYDEWKGWNHLIYGVVKKLYKSKKISYEQLKNEIKEKSIDSMDKYREVYKKYNWPSQPNRYAEFISFYEFFGKDKQEYVSYDELKIQVKKAKIKSIIKYDSYRKKHDKKEWPCSPSSFYDEFKSNFDLFGKKEDYWAKKGISSYKESKTLEQIVKEMKENKVQTRKQYRSKCKSHGWPTNPEDAYKDCWRGWDYFFSREQVDLSWREFKKQVRDAKIKGFQDYRDRYKNFKGWPADPSRKYKKSWDSWMEICGKKIYFGSKDYFRNKMSFGQLKEEVKKAGVKNSLDYRKKYKKYGWTSSPQKSFPSKWKGWDDFLDNKILDFSKLREQVKKENIKGQVEYRKKYKEFVGWPSVPEKIYADEWKDWYHFLSKQRDIYHPEIKK